MKCYWMKFERVVLLIGVCLAMPGFVHADAEADHNALRKIKVVYEDAMNSGDLDKLRPYIASGFTAVMATGDEVKGIDELKTFWANVKKKLGDNVTYHIAVEPELSDLYGDIAIARGKATESIGMGSRKLDLQTNWITILHKENGQWKGVRSQATINAFENPVIDLLLKKAKLIFGLGGLILGIFIGLLIPFRRSKRA